MREFIAPAAGILAAFIGNAVVGIICLASVVIIILIRGKL